MAAAADAHKDPNSGTRVAFLRDNAQLQALYDLSWVLGPPAGPPLRPGHDWELHQGALTPPLQLLCRPGTRLIIPYFMFCITTLRKTPAAFHCCCCCCPPLLLLSGVVPACASLDCLTVFTRSVSEGVLVAGIMETGVAGAQDVWRRGASAAVGSPDLSQGFRFGVPGPEFMEWAGAGGVEMAAQSQAHFEAACVKLKGAGGQQVKIDFAPFAAVAALLYQSSFVAERYSGLRAFLDAGGEGRAAAPEAALQQQRQLGSDSRLLPVTRAIIAGAGEAGDRAGGGGVGGRGLEIVRGMFATCCSKG
jgi:hypothetical protein